MAVTYSTPSHMTSGGKRGTFGTITLDASYPTGGEAVAARGVGLGTIEDLTPSGDDGYIPRWDAANSKIVMYYADYDAVADGALIQVADATDLSTVVLRYQAVGT